MHASSVHWRVPIAEEDGDKTTSRMQRGTYRVCCTKISLTDLSVTFHCTLDILLSGLTRHTCLVNSDDVIGLFDLFQAHCEDEYLVLSTVQQTGVSLISKTLLLYKQSEKPRAHHPSTGPEHGHNTYKKLHPITASPTRSRNQIFSQTVQP